MTPVISPNRFAIYIFSNKNRQITVVLLCNSETFVCEKCQCVHYDCALPLLVQNTDARWTVNFQRNICKLLATVPKCQVSTILQEFAGGSQEFLIFVYFLKTACKFVVCKSESAPNNSNETHTFMCLGRASHFGQHLNCSKIQI